MSYWIYLRINVNVWASNEAVEVALNDWAKTALKPGARLTKKMTREVLKHHRDARRLCEEWRM